MVKRLSILSTAFVVLATMLLVGLYTSTVNAQRPPQPPQEEKVTICHRSNSVTNPYGPKAIEVNKSAVDGEGKNDHTSHEGPLAFSEAYAKLLKENDTKWGDIIPPVDEYPGLNWTEWGQAMYNNDCQFVEPTYFFQFAKVWEGDEVNEDEVDVTFFIGDVAWTLGDDPVKVEAGQELSPLSEQVNGLPENCSYESNLPTAYVVDVPEIVLDADEVVLPPLSQTFTLTATNTVDCEEVEEEEEEEGEVLGETDEPQVTVTPTGGVDAGAGEAMGAAYGLLGSGSMLALGAAIRRKFGL